MFDKYKTQILYLIFGVVTTIVNIVCYAIFAKLLKIDPMISTIIAWILSVIVAFLTNKIYVFESKTNSKNEIVKEVISFFASRLASLGIDVLIMFIGVNLLKIDDMIVKILSNIIVIVINYFLSKYFIFKSKK